MSKPIQESGEKGRLHIDTPLMGASLVSKEFLAIWIDYMKNQARNLDNFIEIYARYSNPG